RGWDRKGELEGEEGRLRSARFNLDKVREEKHVLEDYTFKRTYTDLQSKVDEARRALDRVKTQAAAKRTQAEIDLATKESVLAQETDKLEDMLDQIKKCTVTAP